ncbi:MAG TPA: hypothetical protein VF241_03410 [Propionibacteriaceae bacterium]
MHAPQEYIDLDGLAVDGGRRRSVADGWPVGCRAPVGPQIAVLCHHQDT